VLRDGFLLSDLNLISKKMLDRVWGRAFAAFIWHIMTAGQSRVHLRLVWGQGLVIFSVASFLKFVIEMLCRIIFYSGK
jgi:hypothetical protein